MAREDVGCAASGDSGLAVSEARPTHPSTWARSRTGRPLTSEGTTALARAAVCANAGRRLHFCTSSKGPLYKSRICGMQAPPPPRPCHPAPSHWQPPPALRATSNSSNRRNTHRDVLVARQLPRHNDLRLRKPLALRHAGCGGNSGGECGPRSGLAAHMPGLAGCAPLGPSSGPTSQRVRCAMHVVCPAACGAGCPPTPTWIPARSAIATSWPTALAAPWDTTCMPAPEKHALLLPGQYRSAAGGGPRQRPGSAASSRHIAPAGLVTPRPSKRPGRSAPCGA